LAAFKSWVAGPSPAMTVGKDSYSAGSMIQGGSAAAGLV
jgi:hypothetical protein